MSTKPMEVFPDLHHKMSKKIAQLTKVIYHLNTKNEDHQTELDVLSSNHQVEIQQILKDAAARIGKFKEMVESKQAAINQDAKLEKLQKKHDLEKQAALQEFNSFKTKMAEREQKVSSEFQSRFDTVRKEVDTMNKKFQERVQQFEMTTTDLRKALQDTSASGSTGMQEMARRHEAEVAELVKSSNEKYQSMLLTQLQNQEDLKKELELQMFSERQQLADKYKADLDQELGQIRARLGGDMQEALLAQRRELEEKLDGQKSDLGGRIDKLTADLRSKTEECDRVTTTKGATIADLERRLAALQQSMSEQVGGQEAKAGQLGRELREVSEQLSVTQSKLAAREEEIATLQKIMSDKTAAIVKLETALSKAEEEAARLRKDLETAQSSGASNEQDLKTRLATSEKESASFRTEINQIAATLATVRDDLRKTEKGAQQAAADAAKTIAVLTSDKEMLAARLEELTRNSSSLSEQASAEAAALKKSMLAREDEMRKERLTMADNHQRAIDSMSESHRQALDAAALAQQTQTGIAQAKEAQLAADILAQKKDYEDKLEALQQENSALVASMTEKHAVEVEGLRNSLLSLEGQLQTLSEQGDTERTNLRSEVSKLDLKAKALQKELDAKRKDGERAESVTNGLKSQVESLREELKASQKAFRDKMDMSAAKLEAEWQARLDAQVTLGQKELKDAAEELYKSHRAEVDELVTRHDEEIRALKGLLQKEAGDAAAELANNERMRAKLESDLKEEKTARAAQVAELAAKHAAELKAHEEAKRNELERLRREIMSSSDSRESAMLQSHNAEVDRLNKLVESTAQEYTLKMAAALDAARAAADDVLRVSLEEVRLQLVGEKNDALSEQTRVNAKERVEAKTRADQAHAVTTQELEDTRGQLRDSNGQIASMQKSMADERAERQRREESFVLERDQMLREHESALRKEREMSERKMIELMERANGDVKILKGEHLEVRNKYEDKIRELNGEYRALMERWQKRESRPEDLARIEQLLREMAEKDDLVVKTREEMLYFKREMLNREETYNQKFGRSPNVGVMNVLKPKEEPAPNGRAKPTQMRMVNPQGGSMGMMGGIGGGIGGMDMMGSGSIGGVGGNSTKGGGRR